MHFANRTRTIQGRATIAAAYTERQMLMFRPLLRFRENVSPTRAPQKPKLRSPYRQLKKNYTELKVYGTDTPESNFPRPASRLITVTQYLAGLRHTCDAMNKYTYKDPYLSMWQSAARKVEHQQAAHNKNTLALTSASIAKAGSRSQYDAVAHLVAAQLGHDQTSQPQQATDIRTLSITGVLTDCADIAAGIVKATMTGDKAQEKLLTGELKKSKCDLGWAACLAEFAKYHTEFEHPQYRAGIDAQFTMNDTATIAIIGDWGTGEAPAKAVLAAVKAQKPDLLIHLGDVYYSCTREEAAQNFVSPCRDALGKIPLYSLCGNHDMYAGGSGYYWLVDQIGQKASYFGLSNSKWQILAMDTGFNDRNPLTVATNMTSVHDDEAKHLLGIADKALASGRRLILLSHHQLFSAFEGVGKLDGLASGYNRNLATSFQDLIPKTDLWMWGHEHRLALYEPFMGLQRGRCLGASAVPVFKDEQSYTPDAGLKYPDGAGTPVWNANAQLSTSADDYNHCYAILTLKDKDAALEYFQVDASGNTTSLFRECF